MKLTPPQIRMLGTLAGPEHHTWRFHPDGRKAHGQGVSLTSLQRKGLARFLYDPALIEVTGMPREETEHTCPVCGIEVTGPGWVVTAAGVEVWRGFEETS